jgi:uncharacterized protein (TIGR03437 family)
VLFDGVPAPVVSAQAGQIVAIAPYSLAGKITSQMRVEYNGQTSAASAVPVTDVALGVFTDQPLGKGSALIANADGTRNSATNPVPKGSYVIFYMTGDGIPNTLGIDGRPATAAPFQRPVQTATASAGTLLYAGALPGYAGMMQVNLQIDAATPSGSVPVTIQVGSKSSAPVNVFVQ